jgi:hypothetical protein
MNGALGVSKKTHDRRSKDVLAAGQYAPIEVDDPYEAGEKISVLRQLRSDPLGRLHSHRQIDDAQYYGGRAFQLDFETAERGPRAIDPSKEAVDGGMMPDPLSEARMAATDRLKSVYRELGIVGAAIANNILIQGMTIEAMCAARGANSERDRNYIGRRFRECLDTLAIIYGFA